MFRQCTNIKHTAKEINATSITILKSFLINYPMAKSILCYSAFTLTCRIVDSLKFSGFLFIYLKSSCKSGILLQTLIGLFHNTHINFVYTCVSGRNVLFDNESRFRRTVLQCNTTQTGIHFNLVRF